MTSTSSRVHERPATGVHCIVSVPLGLTCRKESVTNALVALSRRAFTIRRSSGGAYGVRTCRLSRMLCQYSSLILERHVPTQSGVDWSDPSMALVGILRLRVTPCQHDDWTLVLYLWGQCLWICRWFCRIRELDQWIWYRILSYWRPENFSFTISHW